MWRAGALLPPRGALLFTNLCSLFVPNLLQRSNAARCSVNACPPMVYRKGELSKAMMDRDWPHQVALPARRCVGHEYLTIHIFCQAESLSLCRRRHSYRQDDIDMTV